MNSKIEQILKSLYNEISDFERDIEKNRKQIIEFEQTILRIRNNISNSNIRISGLKEAIETINKGINKMEDRNLTCSDCSEVFLNKCAEDDEYNCDNCDKVTCVDCAYDDENQWICKKCPHVKRN